MPGGSGRKRIASRQRSIQGGGGIVTGTANLAWGPAFGRGVGVEELQCACQTLPINAVALDGTKTCGAHLSIDMALDSTKTLGAHLSGTALGAPFWQSEAHAANSDAGGALASLVVSKPAGTGDGDFLLAFIGAADPLSTAVISAPAGWATVATQSFAGATNQLATRSFRLFAGSSEPSSYTFTFSPTATYAVGEIHRLTAVDTTTPVDVSATATLSAAALDPDPDSPSVTTTVTNTMVFAFLFHDHLALSQTHTPGAAHLERTDFQADLSGATFVGAHSQTRVFGSAAATGTIAHNCTETVATDAVMQRVALRPGTATLAS